MGMTPLNAADTRIGPYRLLAELGRGGMGRVYLASGPDGRLVAVKQIDPRYADDQGFRARFRWEVDASRRVSGAHTAAVLDADPDAALPWLASVYVPGPSLGEAVAAVGSLPEGSTRHLAARLASALADIHRAGLVHRDLKPSNVLLGEDGPRVIDFGVVRGLDAGVDQTRTGWLVGSPAYMSPEQALMQPVTAASDMFSLGTVLVVACTGRNPFVLPGDSGETVHNILRARPDLGGVPERLRPIVARCLAKKPDRRPTPAQFLDALRPISPTVRPWPAEVHHLITRQHEAVDRLLRDDTGEAGDIDGTGGRGGTGRTVGSAQPEDGPPVLDATLLDTTGPAAWQPSAPTVPPCDPGRYTQPAAGAGGTFAQPPTGPTDEQSTPEQPSRPIAAPATCTIRTDLTGNYLSVVDGGGRVTDVIHTDATRADTWEWLTLVDAGDGGPYYGIQTSVGTYLTAVNGGGLRTDPIHSDATLLQDWEKFALVPLGQNRYAIRTIDGHYLTANDGGGRTSDALRTDAMAVREWEVFLISCDTT